MSQKVAIIIPEKIQLIDIKVFQSNLETSNDFLNTPQQIISFDFGFGQEIAHNIQLNRSRYRLFFTLEANDGDNKQVGLKADYGIEFHFEVENFKDFLILSNEKGTQIDANLGATLLGMAYSTSRGIILEKTHGTFFQGFILPVINPFKALKEEENRK